MLKEGTHCVCSLIHYVFKMGKNYYPQVFLEKCKYIVKNNKMNSFTNSDFWWVWWGGFSWRKWYELRLKAVF